MTRRIRPPAVVAGGMGLALATAFAVAAITKTGIEPGDGDGLQPLPSHRQTSVDIVDRLRDGHFIRKDLDDDVSSQTFDNYLGFLDPRRLHFLADDIVEFERYRHQLDDALREGDLEPAFVIYNRYRRRALERIEFEAELIEQGVDRFDFSIDESIDLDRSEAPWADSRMALEDLWRLDLKSSVLLRKLAGESLDDLAKTLAKRGRNRARVIGQTRSEDVFQRFVNAFALTYDEHTQYFSPRDSEDFGISMSLSLEGIGIVLGTEDEYTVVRGVVKGGPADKGGELKARDRIVAVGQSGEEPFVDIVGWRSDDVVQLIRGPKGSAVRLKVIPAGSKDADVRVVRIVREAVRLVEQSASKSLLEVDRNGRERRIGVVVVPTFYADYKAKEKGDPGYRSTTRDVARLIEELKSEGMDALIVDLRHNGGGSLQEAVELAGLFVESGPVVQVKSLRGRAAVLGSKDGTAVWDGPLAVLVNRGSASASEIFAGAIQDYDLGLVVGSRTFGKGTVQTLLELPQHRGQIKLTERKFYRVSGTSTHYNGIVPDIEYPAPYDVFQRDRSDGGAIGGRGSDVAPISHSASDRTGPYLAALRSRHEQRVAHDPDFAYLRSRGEYLEDMQARTELSLSEEVRLAQKAADDARRLQLENDLLVAKGGQPVASLDELDGRGAWANDPDEPENDTLVRETANILIDYLDLSGAVALADRATRTAVE